MLKTIPDIVLLFDCKDRTGRTYSKDEILSEISKNNTSFYGILGTEYGFPISMDKISHSISNLRLEGNDLVGDIDILDTPMGNMLFQMTKMGVKFRTVMRAVGNLDQHTMSVTELTIGGWDMEPDSGEL
jgi:hypothetical protein